MRAHVCMNRPYEHVQAMQSICGRYSTYAVSSHASLSNPKPALACIVMHNETRSSEKPVCTHASSIALHHQVPTEDPAGQQAETYDPKSPVAATGVCERIGS